jgi:hypothetical protein
MWRWLVRDWQWPGAAMFASVFLLAMLPVFAGATGFALALVFIQLPIYMIHQGEEHIGDRFRLHINRTLGGRELLTPAATFWINALGVWAFNIAALCLAWFVEPTAGLAAGYLSVVNGIIHVAQGIKRREYNPGLVTAILLLIPAGLYCVFRVGADADVLSHVVGLLAAIAVHVAIIIHVVRRYTALSKSVDAPVAIDRAQV